MCKNERSVTLTMCKKMKTTRSNFLYAASSGSNTLHTQTLIRSTLEFRVAPLYVCVRSKRSRFMLVELHKRDTDSVC